MKVTILTAYFFPEITAATHLLSDLASDLAKYGAEVTIITNVPTRGINEKVRKEYLGYKNEVKESNLRIIRVGTNRRESNFFLLRGLRYIRNAFSIYKTAKKIKTDVYLISSTPPILGIVGALLSKKTATVYNMQDVFPDSLINSDKIKENSKIVKIFRKIERYTYKKNNYIITISSDFKRLLNERGVKDDKVSVIYNWIDENQVKCISRNDNYLIKRYNLDNNLFYITYCGNIGHSQNLEMVVDIVREFEQVIPDIFLIIIGDGAWKEKINKHIIETTAKNIRLLPFQPYEDISHVMSLGDISLVCSKLNVGTSSFPSKTWSIMSASRPVVCSFDVHSELCEIIQNSNSGVCVPPEDKEALKNVIIDAYNNREKMSQLGENGRQYVENNLTRKVATRKYYDILNTVVKREKGE